MRRTIPTDPDVRLLAAAADPTRLAILRQLSTDGPTCACDFTAGDQVSQPTVSHHLRVLREAGWVDGERRGTWIWYALRPEAAERLGLLAGSLRPGSSRPAGVLGGRPGVPRGRPGAVATGDGPSSSREAPAPAGRGAP